MEYTTRQLVRTALQEDASWGDVTSESLISEQWATEMVLLLKEDGVAAGLTLAEQVFRELDPGLEWETVKSEGIWLKSGTELAVLSGKSRALLQAERVALNFLQRLSGIATLTYRYVQEARKGSSTVRIVDTRKTTPGLRYWEKYAVQQGGGHNHRYNLSDAVMVKDNHLAILAQHGKSFSDAIKLARQHIPHTMKIEVEVDSLSQIDEALAGGADIILLDNMTCEELKRAVSQIDNRAITEASGGVKLENVAEIAATGVNIISVGALTHSAPSLDISLDFKAS